MVDAARGFFFVLFLLRLGVGVGCSSSCSRRVLSLVLGFLSTGSGRWRSWLFPSSLLSSGPSL